MKSQHRKIMTRKASDNKYLHKDFHVSMNILLKYIYESFGEKELINYLSQYAEAYYKPLNQELRDGSIEALNKYFTDMYEKEEWAVKIVCKENSLIIEQDSCPGILHIRAKGEAPCPCYSETYNTVYRTLCKGTPFEYELSYFDEETGACNQIFRRMAK